MLKIRSSLSEAEEQIVFRVIGCGITVHRELGPGFKESIYEKAFCLELDSCGLKFECEKRIEVRYKEWQIPGQKVDLIVESLVLVEIKAVSKLKPLHTAQAISYLKTTRLPVGLLMNFNAVTLKQGMKRLALSDAVGRGRA